MSDFTSQELSDREQIRDVAIRYCRGVDRLDAEVMKSAYWPDAVDEHGTFNGNAHEFVDHCMVSHTKWSWTMHSIYNHLIELDDPTTARGEVYNITNLCRAEGGEIDTWYGRYLDRYEKRNGDWRIIHRVCVHEGTATSDTPPMPIAAELFRPGSLDRGTPGRPIGP